MRLIDADALNFEDIAKDYDENGMYITAEAFKAAQVIINVAPTVDPVRHGHGVIGVGGFYTCSECGEDIIMRQAGYKLYAPKYCYNCGAMMESA